MARSFRCGAISLTSREMGLNRRLNCDLRKQIPLPDRKAPTRPDKRHSDITKWPSDMPGVKPTVVGSNLAAHPTLLLKIEGSPQA